MPNLSASNVQCCAQAESASRAVRCKAWRRCDEQGRGYSRRWAIQWVLWFLFSFSVRGYWSYVAFFCRRAENLEDECSWATRQQFPTKSLISSIAMMPMLYIHTCTYVKLFIQPILWFNTISPVLALIHKGSVIDNTTTEVHVVHIASLWIIYK